MIISAQRRPFKATEYAGIVLNDKPVAYYRLDETSGIIAHDISGNGNNGTIIGGVTLGQAGATVNDAAMKFDGSTGYIEVAGLSVSGTFTVEAWVNTSRATALSAIMGSRGVDTFDLKLINGTTVHGDIGNGSGWITITADASLNYVVNTWYHIVRVVTSTSYTTYANGTQIGTGTFGTSTPLLCNGSNPLTIGSDGPDLSPSEYASGLIDEVAIYNYALSAAQVQSHYNAGKTGAIRM